MQTIASLPRISMVHLIPEILSSMSVANYLLQLPSVWFFLLIISVGAILAGTGTYLYRKYTNLRILRSHNEVIGFVFMALASFYAFLLSFIVFIVWGQMYDIRGNVSKEGSSAMGLYRDIKFYPDTIESKQLMIVYLDFIYNVIDEEFPNMEQKKQGRKTQESFDRVFYKIEHLNPKNPFQIQLVAEMFNHLNELSTYRGLRDTSQESQIPAVLWWPMLLGAVITVFTCMLLDIGDNRLHITLNALLGTFIAMHFFIILLLDHPYSGSLGIKPQSYKQIFTMEQWDKEQAAITPPVGNPGDAFDLVKKERMLSDDSSFVSEEIIEASMKTEIVKKKETVDEWTLYKIETTKKIRNNEEKIQKIKGQPNLNAGTRKKLDALEKSNNNLKISLEKYNEEVKSNWELFKATMSESVIGIDNELNTIKSNQQN